jgi:hypothetical protein
MTVAGHKIDLDDLMSGDAHADIVRWLWTVMLADGTRALTSAGRWAEALESVTTHTGIGDRLLDGRQVAVIAHLHAGQQDTARSLLTTTRPSEAWEHPVRHTLSLLYDPHGFVRFANEGQLPELLREAADGADLVVFRTRLTLAAIDLTPTRAHAAELLEAVHADPAIYTDGYAARDVLTHPTSNQMTPSSRFQLEGALAAAGLDNSVQPGQLRRLLDIACASHTITSQHLPRATP